MMQFDIKLLDSPDQIVAKILQAMAGHLRKSIRFAKYDILRRSKDAIEKAITTSPEYISLLGGKLQGELGVPDSASRLKSLLDIWLNEIEIVERPVRIIGDRIVGGLRFSAVRRSLRDALNSSEATYTTASGETIPWLQWLCVMGDAVIIRDYAVDFSNTANSRTGLAIMVGDIGNNWFVPPEYSGTLDDNFITRALQGVVPVIEKIIEDEIVTQVKKP